MSEERLSATEMIAATVLLSVTKQRFGCELMENELIARLVMETVRSSKYAQASSELPDFTLEPWLPGDDAVGLRLTFSTGVGGDDTFEHVKLIAYVYGESDKTLLVSSDGSVVIAGSDELMAVDATLAEKQQAALKFIELWYEFCQTAGELKARLDQVTRTFTTEECH